MKKEVKQSAARQRKYVTGTGGGPFKDEEKVSLGKKYLFDAIC